MAQEAGVWRRNPEPALFDFESRFVQGPEDLVVLNTNDEAECFGAIEAPAGAWVWMLFGDDEVIVPFDGVDRRANDAVAVAAALEPLQAVPRVLRAVGPAN